MNGNIKAVRGTTFQEAAPHGLTALGIAGASLYLSLTAKVTALKITMAIFAVLGSIAFTAIVICGFIYSSDPKAYREKVKEYVITFMGQTIADLISKIAVEVISSCIDKLLGRQSFRVSLI